LSKEVSDRHITLRFGSGLTGIFAPGETSKGRPDTWRGAVRLGAGSPTLHDVAGLLRVDGHAKHLSLDQWLPLLTAAQSTADQAQGQWLSGALPPGDMPSPTFQIKIPAGKRKTGSKQQAPAKTIDVVEQFDIEIDKLTAFSRTFRNLKLKAGPGDDGSWYVQVQGGKASGYVRLPAADTNEAIVADFAHLQLPATNHSGKQGGADPRKIPSVHFTCKNLTYDTWPLGNTRFELARTPQGLAVKAIDIRSKGLRIKGHGAWEQSASARSSSRLWLDIRARDLGKLLSSFGYEGKVAKKGKTHLKLNATWPGSLTQFDLGRANGSLDVKVEDGRLMAIEPGATGRVFGLLSVTLLPRRLLLDFRDLYEEGFIYDRMEGKFTIARGKAETTRFAVEGPTSHIDITGSTGLVNKDYDQMVTIIPKLASASLPLAAVGIPLAAIGIAQYLLDEPFFDKVFAYQYTIGGTWDDPKIELVETEWESTE
ncbi:MAG: hypothetical protein KJO08_01575, partial [Gammaproteobacteria bacterium]|nr:hypothetical protein [Gammaproteobacteria bacterium]NNJ85224.1 hypothetical protein [Gammaproteobacteria bacterium]